MIKISMIDYLQIQKKALQVVFFSFFLVAFATDLSATCGCTQTYSSGSSVSPNLTDGSDVICITGNVTLGNVNNLGKGDDIFCISNGGTLNWSYTNIPVNDGSVTVNVQDGGTVKDGGSGSNGRLTVNVLSGGTYEFTSSNNLTYQNTNTFNVNQGGTLLATSPSILTANQLNNQFNINGSAFLKSTDFGESDINIGSTGVLDVINDLYIHSAAFESGGQITAGSLTFTNKNGTPDFLSGSCTVIDGDISVDAGITVNGYMETTNGDLILTTNGKIDGNGGTIVVRSDSGNSSIASGGYLAGTDMSFYDNDNNGGINSDGNSELHGFDVFNANANSNLFAIAGSLPVVCGSSNPGCTPPVVTITGETSICEGESTVLTASGGGTYAWSHGLGSNEMVTVSPNNTVSYTVTVTDQGCSATASISVTANGRAQWDDVHLSNDCGTLEVDANHGITGDFNVQYTVGGSTYTEGPFSTPSGFNLSGQGAGTYTDITIVGIASGCTDVWPDDYTVNDATLTIEFLNGFDCANADTLTVTSNADEFECDGNITYRWETRAPGSSNWIVITQSGSQQSGSGNYGHSENFWKFSPPGGTLYIKRLVMICNGCEYVSNEIQETPEPNTNASSNEVCSSETVTLTGSSPNTGTWMLEGTHPEVTLGSTTNGVATVTFDPLVSSQTFTFVYNTGCEVAESILVRPEATVDAGDDVEECQLDSPVAILLDDAVIGGSASSGTWTFTPSNGGTLSSETASASPQNVTFTPAIGFIGNVVLTLTTNNPSGTCDSASDTKTISINPAVTISATAVQPDCSDDLGVITFTTGGGTGIKTVSYDGNIVTSPMQNLGANSYVLTVTDEKNCTTTTSVVIDAAPSVLMIEKNSTDVSCHGLSDGSIDVTVSGGTASYTYNWSDISGIDNEADRSDLSTGTFSLTVTDTKGCSTSTSVVIDQPDEYTIGDYVWIDANGNGFQDNGEAGLNGVTVELYNALNNELEQSASTTDLNGNPGFYNFVVCEGDYYVVFGPNPIINSVEYSFTNINGVLSAANNSDAGIVNGQTVDFTVNAINPNPDYIDAGYVAPASIGDYVWVDSNGNGIQDLGEAGLDGVVVSLTTSTGGTVTDLDGNAVGTETTSNGGAYLFDNLPAGSYKVTFEESATISGVDYSLTDANADGLDTEAGDTNTDSDAGAMGMSQIVVLDLGEDEEDIDAGYVAPASIGDYVWVDSNGNGIQDLGEAGLDGVVVSLTTSTGGTVTDLDGNAVGTETTSNGGAYLFDNLPAGSYKVTFEESATLGGVDYTLTDANADSDASEGGDTNTDSDAGAMGMSQIVVLDLGEDEEDIDAGYVAPASIGDYVWVDANGNGIQDNGESGLDGVVVSLTKSTGGTVTDLDGNAVGTETTSNGGAYLFDNLPAGSYKVTFEESATLGGVDYSLTDANADGLDTEGGDTNTDSDAGAMGMSQIVVLDLGEDEEDIDAGYLIPASIGNYVWFDLNGDGIQDNDEAGIDGVVVKLSDGNGNPVFDLNGNEAIDQITSNGGYYSFDTLKPGDYIVEFEVSPTVQSLILELTEKIAEDPGGRVVDPDEDSDASPITGFSQTVTLGPGDRDTTIDAGYIADASIGNYVWQDLDQDGIQDSGEPGISGVEVVLWDLINDVSDTIYTDANGYYLFDELNPGDYYVEFVDPSGFIKTMSHVGNDILDSDASQIDGTSDDIILLAGVQDTTIDAGYIELARIGDTVWIDANANGVYEDGESGLAGVQVTLLDGDSMVVTTDAYGNAISPITTGSNGYYEFTDLLPGDYVVQFGDVTGYVKTLQDIGNDTIDSDAGSEGYTPVYTLAQGDNNSTVDAGYVPSNLIICGNVYYDLNQLKDNTVNGYSYIPGGINALLIKINPDDSEEVAAIKSIPVSSQPNTGVFEFIGQAFTKYYVILSTSNPSIGDVAPNNSSLPPTYINTGENVGAGPGHDGVKDGTSSIFETSTINIKEINFGIIRFTNITID